MRHRTTGKLSRKKQQDLLSTLGSRSGGRASRNSRAYFLLAELVELGGGRRTARRSVRRGARR
jgi:hypothetical protein